MQRSPKQLQEKNQQKLSRLTSTSSFLDGGRVANTWLNVSAVFVCLYLYHCWSSETSSEVAASSTASNSVDLGKAHQRQTRLDFNLKMQSGL